LTYRVIITEQALALIDEQTAYIAVEANAPPP